MNSINSFLDNSIVNNTIRLFLILYAGYIYKVDTTHLHTLLNQKIFSIAFITLVMFALTRKFWFSLLLTVAFYAFFHFLSALENKEILSVHPKTKFVAASYTFNNNFENTNNKKQNNNTAVHESDYDLDDTLENNNLEEIKPNVTENQQTNVSFNQQINVSDNQQDKTNSWNKIQQYINLQTDNTFDKPGDIKFIDVSSALKKEHIVPHNTYEIKIGKF